MILTDVKMSLLKKAPAAVPGCGNRPEDGPQSRLFSGESKMVTTQAVGVRQDIHKTFTRTSYQSHMFGVYYTHYDSPI